MARDYLICDGAVKMQVTWISDLVLDKNNQPHWTYLTAIKSASKIPDYFLCLLKNKQYPFPPGQSISPGYDCAHLPPAGVDSP